MSSTQIYENDDDNDCFVYFHGDKPSLYICTQIYLRKSLHFMMSTEQQKYAPIIWLNDTTAACLPLSVNFDKVNQFVPVSIVKFGIVDIMSIWQIFLSTKIKR